MRSPSFSLGPRLVVALALALAGAGCSNDSLNVPSGGGGATVTGAGGGVGSPADAGSSKQGPELRLSPGVEDFPRTSIGPAATAPTRTFTVTNAGGEPTGALQVATSEGETFVVADHDCGVLPPAGTCAVAVRFRPAKAGLHSGTLRVTDEAHGLRQEAAVTGTGIQPATVAVFPPPWTFADTDVGVRASLAYLLVNSGEEATGPIAFKATGDTADFALDPATCAQPLPAALPGQTTTCSFQLSFAPTSAAPKHLTVEIAAHPGGDLTFEVDANAAGAAEP
jgi:hypothetical protein